jgi:hypothetical protein
VEVIALLKIISHVYLLTSVHVKSQSRTTMAACLIPKKMQVLHERFLSSGSMILPLAEVFPLLKIKSHEYPLTSITIQQVMDA